MGLARKKKRISPTDISGGTPRQDPGPSVPGRGFFWCAFFLVLLFSLVLKIYKAHYIGITYDEAMTFMHYCPDVHTALTNFNSTNNHVLNSVFICWAHKFFGSYEHFIRIPSLMAGIIFSLALAYVVYKLISSPALKVVTLALVSLVPFIFDYSFLARGYAFGLAAITSQIAFVLWLLKRKISYRYWYGPVLVISLLNFISFGAMMSSVITLAAFNLTFIFFGVPRIFSDAPGKKYPLILTGSMIFFLSAAASFLLHKGIYKNIFNNDVFLEISSTWQGWSSFVELLKGLLVVEIFSTGSRGGNILLGAALILLSISGCFHLDKFRRAIKAGNWRTYLSNADRESFLLVVTGLTAVFMFIYGVALHKSLGLVRNNIFMVPLLLISGAITLDRFAGGLKNKVLSHAVCFIVFGIFAGVVLHNPPSLYHNGSIGTSISGPLLRKLKAVDPDKIWMLAFSKEKNLAYMAFTYYRQFGYHFKQAREQEQPDVVICTIDEMSSRNEIPTQPLCLEWDCFRKADSVVLLNKPLPLDKVVISARYKND